MKILLTGATGFTGSHLAEKILAETDWEIFSLERITARPNQLGANAFSPRIHRMYHDFRAQIPRRILDECEGVDYIIHNGAEVHGLRSIENPDLFVHTNVMGTFNMLEAARVLKPRKFIYVSSAEAVGSAPAPHSWDEVVTLKPSNPYAAAKGAGELLTRSYHQSFGVPGISVRTMNIFGARQDTSKFVPATIKKILDGSPVYCHVDKDNNSGSRHWIHVKALVQAMFNLLEQGEAGQTYHVVGPEMTNLKVIQIISRGLNRPCDLHFIIPGPSHDLRYSIRDTKLDLDCYATGDTEEMLLKTVEWFDDHQEWLV